MGSKRLIRALCSCIIVYSLLRTNLALSRDTRSFFKTFVDAKQSAGQRASCTTSPCCTSWDGPNYDEWWVHHPTWMISSEDESGFCFSNITNTEHANYLQSIYNMQWKQPNCSDPNMIQSFQVSSGYSASLYRVVRNHYAAFSTGHPYQMTKHWYGAKSLFATKDNSSWAYCNETDLTCYLLPWSPCPPEYKRNQPVKFRRNNYKGTKYEWFSQYAIRLQQKVRRKIMETRMTYPSIAPGVPCTAMHIRRNDAGLNNDGRRYASVSEYLQVGNVQKGDTIVLLTDDASTLEEIQRFHPDYDWKYPERPRNTGTKEGFDAHNPSGDSVADFLALQAEIKMASRCHKFVHGVSGFTISIMDGMVASGNFNFTKHFVNTADTENTAKLKGKGRGDILIKQILAEAEAKGNLTS